MEFRLLTESDFERASQIFGEARANIGKLGIDQWQNGYPEPEIIHEDLAKQRLWGAWENDRLLGLCVLYYGGEPTYDDITDGAWLTSSDSADPHYVAIHRVAVASDARGRGVASFLMSQGELEAQGQGAESARVDTHPGNIPMQRMLEKNGYVRCGDILTDLAGDMSPERVAYEKILQR